MTFMINADCKIDKIFTNVWSVMMFSVASNMNDRFANEKLKTLCEYYCCRAKEEVPLK